MGVCLGPGAWGLCHFYSVELLPWEKAQCGVSLETCWLLLACPDRAGVQRHGRRGRLVSLRVWPVQASVSQFTDESRSCLCVHSSGDKEGEDKGSFFIQAVRLEGI